MTVPSKDGLAGLTMQSTSVQVMSPTFTVMSTGHPWPRTAYFCSTAPVDASAAALPAPPPPTGAAPPTAAPAPPGTPPSGMPPTGAASPVGSMSIAPGPLCSAAADEDEDEDWRGGERARGGGGVSSYRDGRIYIYTFVCRAAHSVDNITHRRRRYAASAPHAPSHGVGGGGGRALLYHDDTRSLSSTLGQRRPHQ